MPITIKTENPGIELWQLVANEAPYYLEAVEANRDHLSQFGDETATKYPDLASVTDSILDPANPDKLRMGIWDGTTFVGSINLTPDGDEAEIGYWLDGRYTGFGYATLATKAMSNYARARYSRVYAEVVEGNEASAHVLERSGFRQTAKEAGRLIFELEEEREPSSKVEITPTTPDDLDDVIRHMEVCYTDTYPNNRGITPDMFEGNVAFQTELRQHLERQLAKRSNTLFIARINDQVVGTIGIGINPEDSTEGKVWGFYVNLMVQNQGIGNQLWQRLLHQVKSEDFSTLILDVAKDAKAAQTFYLDKGFMIIGEEDWDWPHWTEERLHNQYWLMKLLLDR